LRFRFRVERGYRIYHKYELDIMGQGLCILGVGVFSILGVKIRFKIICMMWVIEFRDYRLKKGFWGVRGSTLKRHGYKGH
jgi:hypothetical protein